MRGLRVKRGSANPPSAKKAVRGGKRAWSVPNTRGNGPTLVSSA